MYINGQVFRVSKILGVIIRYIPRTGFSDAHSVKHVSQNPTHRPLVPKIPGGLFGQIPPSGFSGCQPCKYWLFFSTG